MTRPVDGASSSPSTFNSVLFPDPDGPITARNSPPEMPRLTLFKATVSTFSVR
jgi:hypothetical protein